MNRGTRIATTVTAFALGALASACSQPPSQSFNAHGTVSGWCGLSHLSSGETVAVVAPTGERVGLGHLRVKPTAGGPHPGICGYTYSVAHVTGNYLSYGIKVGDKPTHTFLRSQMHRATLLYFDRPSN